MSFRGFSDTGTLLFDVKFDKFVIFILCITPFMLYHKMNPFDKFIRNGQLFPTVLLDCFNDIEELPWLITPVDGNAIQKT